jgi:hypothetical protein
MTILMFAQHYLKHPAFGFLLITLLHVFVFGYWCVTFYLGFINRSEAREFLAAYYVRASNYSNTVIWGLWASCIAIYLMYIEAFYSTILWFLIILFTSMFRHYGKIKWEEERAAYC